MTLFPPSRSYTHRELHSFFLHSSSFSVFCALLGFISPCLCVCSFIDDDPLSSGPSRVCRACTVRITSGMMLDPNPVDLPATEDEQTMMAMERASMATVVEAGGGGSNTRTLLARSPSSHTRSSSPIRDSLTPTSAASTPVETGSPSVGTLHGRSPILPTGSIMHRQLVSASIAAPSAVASSAPPAVPVSVSVSVLPTPPPPPPTPIVLSLKWQEQGSADSEQTPPLGHFAISAMSDICDLHVLVTRQIPALLGEAFDYLCRGKVVPTELWYVNV